MVQSNYATELGPGRRPGAQDGPGGGRFQRRDMAHGLAYFVLILWVAFNGGESESGGGGGARTHCRFAPPLIHFTPCSLTYSAPLFLKRQCDRTLRRRRAQRGFRARGRRDRPPPHRGDRGAVANRALGPGHGRQAHRQGGPGGAVGRGRRPTRSHVHYHRRPLCSVRRITSEMHRAILHA